MEILTCLTCLTCKSESMEAGIIEAWNHVTLELWKHGYWNHSIMELWKHESIYILKNRKMESWNNGIKWNNITVILNHYFD